MVNIVLQEDYYDDELVEKIMNIGTFKQTIDCVNLFKEVQKKNYNVDYIRKSKINEKILELDDYITNLSKIYYWRYYEYVNDIYASKSIIYNMKLRLRINSETKVKTKRKTDNIFGKFEHTLSPSMVQHMRIWWNKLENRKSVIKPGKKEYILSQFKSNRVKIDPKFCSLFIEDVYPIRYIREWGISSHLNGKRRTNKILRELLKKEFYSRDRNYLRICICGPNLRRLPLSIENKIKEYLYY
jgi:hypothetical protein